jgi:ATP-dependent protease HslVU (ClpYQ) peptidase subunit
MTVICAARDASGTYLACDLMSRAGDVINTVKTKLVLTKRWAVGFSGLSRFRQVVERNAPALDLCETAYDAADAVRLLIIEDGAQRNEGRGEAMSFELEMVLVDCRNGDFFRIFGDCSLIEADRFTACGSGVETALGAMWAISQRSHVGAHELVELGISAASALSAGCGRGMVVQKVWAPVAADPYTPQIPDSLYPYDIAARSGWRPEEREYRERAQDHVDVLCSEREGLTVLQAQQAAGGF